MQGLAQEAPPITQSGLRTQVDLSSTPPTGRMQYDITGGTRAGTNLFHSFGTFNVPNGVIANFQNDTGLDTTNILSRVTGGQTSTIFGTIQTSGFEQANLFLMNPAGIVFGPKASLNVGGSVAFTTADYLRFADNGQFKAVPNVATDALLSTTPVAAYGFLSSNPGAITVQGSHLTVHEGHGMSLVGGNITIDSAKLTADGARPAPPTSSVNQINLASVASPGEVLGKTLSYAPNITGQSFTALRTIQVSNTSVIDASGSGGGTVRIRGSQFVLENSTISANVTRSGPITNGAESVADGIDIDVTEKAVIRSNAVLETNILGSVTPDIAYPGVHIQAGHIEIAGAGFPPSFTGVRSNVGAAAQPRTQGGKSGNITLESDSILINGMGTLETIIHGVPAQPGAPPSASPRSTAGDITITANHDIELNGSIIQSYISSHAGAAGNITLTSRHGAIIASGNLLPPGFIPIATEPLPPVIPNIIFAQSLLSPGTAGTVRMTAPEGDIRLAGMLMTLTLQPVPNGPPIQEAGSGQVLFNARDMELTNNSSIQMDNFSTLPAGNFDISLSGKLMVNSAQILTTARGSAQAAALTVHARDMVIRDGAILSTETMSRGAGGQLNLAVDTLHLLNGGQLRSGNTIPTQSPGAPLLPVPSGAGGTISIQGESGPANSVLIDGQASGIISGTQGTGPAGNIDLTAHTVTLQNGGTIFASTTGRASSATGGSILIHATDQVSLANQASIRAGSTGTTAGNAGDITLNAGQQLDVRDGSSITTATESTQANGGDITIQAIDQVQFVNSTLSTSVRGTDGSGGNIFIDPKVVVLQGSTVTAQAVGGAGGNITFVTPLFLADSASVVNASSQRGPSGTVTVQSPTSNLSSAVGQLVSKITPPQILIQNRCVASTPGAQSTFILAGRDTLPAEPGGWLSSPISMEHWTGKDAEHASGMSAKNIKPSHSPARLTQVGDNKILSLRRLTPPGFLVRAFANPSTGCPS